MSKPVVLLIEDNREVRLSARFILEDHGFNITELENPTQAIDYLQQQSADLIPVVAMACSRNKCK